jgi:hypothetical protein
MTGEPTKPLSHLAGHRQVAFALVSLERIGERRDSFLVTTGGQEDLGEVAQRSSLEVEPVGLLHDRARARTHASVARASRSVRFAALRRFLGWAE